MFIDFLFLLLIFFLVLHVFFLLHLLFLLLLFLLFFFLLLVLLLDSSTINPFLFKSMAHASLPIIIFRTCIQYYTYMHTYMYSAFDSFKRLECSISHTYFIC